MEANEKRIQAWIWLVVFMGMLAVGYRYMVVQGVDALVLIYFTGILFMLAFVVSLMPDKNRYMNPVYGHEPLPQAQDVIDFKGLIGDIIEERGITHYYCNYAITGETKGTDLWLLNLDREDKTIHVGSDYSGYDQISEYAKSNLKEYKEEQHGGFGTLFENN